MKPFTKIVNFLLHGSDVQALGQDSIVIAYSILPNLFLSNINLKKQPNAWL